MKGTSYDGMNMDEIDEGVYLALDALYDTNAWLATVVTEVARHTLPRVWSPDKKRRRNKQFLILKMFLLLTSKSAYCTAALIRPTG